MNPQWNTPPDGDFARYVERLTAQAALPKRAPHDGDHGLDVGMTPVSDALNNAAAAGAQRNTSSSNGPVAAPDLANASAVIVKVVAGVGAVVLVGLWATGVPLGLLLILAAGGVWLAYKLKRLQLPGTGVAKWQRVLEDAAREQREKQKQRQGK